MVTIKPWSCHCGDKKLAAIGILSWRAENNHCQSTSSTLSTGNCLILLQLRHLVHERTIPTERPPLSAKLVPTFEDRGVSRGQRNRSPFPHFSSILHRTHYYFFQVAPQLYCWPCGPSSRSSTAQKIW
jgi:hypothetical protein